MSREGRPFTGPILTPNALPVTKCSYLKTDMHS